MNSHFNFLGLARKANALYIGQDEVLSALKESHEMYLLVSDDVSATLLRKLQAIAQRSNISIIHTNLSRREIGSLLGIESSSIVAIKKNNSFAEKIKQIEFCNNHSKE